MAPELFGDSGLLTPSVMTPSPIVQKSGTKYSWSETKQKWRISHANALRLTCLVTLNLTHASPLKRAFYPQTSSVDCWTTVSYIISPARYFKSLCDFNSPNDVTFLGLVRHFPILTLSNRSRVGLSACFPSSIGNGIRLVHSLRELRTLVRRRLPVSKTMTVICDNLFEIVTSTYLSKCIRF